MAIINEPCETEDLFEFASFLHSYDDEDLYFTEFCDGPREYQILIDPPLTRYDYDHQIDEYDLFY